MKPEYMHYAGDKNKIEAKVATIQFAARYRFMDILDELKLQFKLKQKCDEQVLARA